MHPMFRRSSRSGLALVLSGAALAATAQVADGSTQFGIGAAALVAREGYRGAGNESRVIPGLSIENKWVRLYGPQLDLRLLGDERRSWWVGPRIEYRFDGYEASDSPFLAGMAERKAGVFGGLAAVYGFGDGWGVELDYVRASKSERGAVASAAVGKAFRAGRVLWRPQLGVEWTSKKYVDYYYGVRASEATAARPAYAGKASTAVEVGLLVSYAIDRRQNVFANFNYERYGSAIRNSPIVDKSGVPQLLVGYQYTWR